MKVLILTLLSITSLIAHGTEDLCVDDSELKLISPGSPEEYIPPVIRSTSRLDVGCVLLSFVLIESNGGEVNRLLPHDIKIEKTTSNHYSDAAKEALAKWVYRWEVVTPSARYKQVFRFEFE